MAYVIGDSCISCGSCAGQCPVGAISEGDGKYEINPEGFKRLGEHVWESDDGRYMLIKTVQAGEP